MASRGRGGDPAGLSLDRSDPLTLKRGEKRSWAKEVSLCHNNKGGRYVGLEGEKQGGPLGRKKGSNRKRRS